MKRILFPLSILAVLVVLLPVASQAAPAPEWTIDAAHSTVGFSVRHVFTQVTGTFDRVSGTVRFDAANLPGSKIDVTIPVDSVNTRNAQRDAHLKTPDFFDATRFPNMRYVSDSIVARGGNHYTAHGRLTIRDVTRPVDLAFDHLGSGDHPMHANLWIAGATAKTTISRTAFGVGSGNFAMTAVVGDEIEITLQIEATRPKPEAATAPVAAPATPPARR